MPDMLSATPDVGAGPSAIPQGETSQARQHKRDSLLHVTRWPFFAAMSSLKTWAFNSHGMPKRRGFSSRCQTWDKKIQKEDSDSCDLKHAKNRYHLRVWILCKPTDDSQRCASQPWALQLSARCIVRFWCHMSPPNRWRTMFARRVASVMAWNQLWGRILMENNGKQWYVDINEETIPMKSPWT